MTGKPAAYEAQKILDIAGVILLVVDRLGIVTMINKKGCQILGYQKEEIVGKNWFEHFVPTEHKDTVAKVAHQLLAGEPEQVSYHENPVLTRSGEQRLIAWKNTIVRDDKGKIVAHLSSGDDLTDSRKSDRKHRFFHEIAQQTPDSIICSDNDFRIIYANQAAQKLFGWTMDELRGQSPDILNADPRAEQIQKEIYQKVSSGQLVEGEALNRRKDNNTFVCHFTIAPLFDQQGEIMAYMGVQRDITKQKMLESALRASLHETEALFQATKQSLLSTDFYSTCQAIFEICASHFSVEGIGLALWDKPSSQTELFLYRPGKPLLNSRATNWLTQCPWRQQALQRKSVTYSNQNDTQHYCSLGLTSDKIHKNILYAPLVLDDNVVGLLGLVDKPTGFYSQDARVASAFADVVAFALREHQTKKRLRESEEKHRTLFDSSADAIMTLAPPAWKFTSGNPSTIKMFALEDESEFISRAPWHYSPEHQPNGQLSVDQALAMIETAMQQGSHFFEWTHRRLSGEDFPATVLLTRIELAGQSLLQATVRDMTEQIDMEMQLSHSRKLEAVGQLAAGIAHEINTPTQFVSDSVHFLKEAFEDLHGVFEKYKQVFETMQSESKYTQLLQEIRQEEEHADLEYIEQNVPSSFDRCLEGLSRISQIVRAMKEFAHPDQREKRHTDINQALLTTLTIANNELKYVADVETDLQDIPQVRCHIGDLNQVFLNLLVNAADAISEVIGDSQTRGKIRVRTSCDDQTVCIEIEDTGAGIPKSVVDRIFEPFFTTKEVGKGSGQGLAIAHSIVVDRHQGSLTVDTSKGVGTTFRIRIPVDG